MRSEDKWCVFVVWEAGMRKAWCDTRDVEDDEGEDGDGEDDGGEDEEDHF